MTAWQELLARQEAARQRTLARATEDLLRVMSNEEGLARLAEISDEEWARAEGEGEE